MAAPVRHRLSTRLWHWTNALALVTLLMSGLMIFNAHPRLYWGEYGSYEDPAWLEIGATRSGRGLVKAGGVTVETTGLLGIAPGPDGQPARQAFPHWLTIPSHYSLADARLWHMALAWVLSLALLFHLPRALRRPGEWRGDYNRGQRVAYGLVLFAALPAMIWTGMAMAPGMDAAWPFLTEWLGGRQTARSIHFIVAMALAAFLLGHLAMLALSRPFARLRGMITGNGGGRDD